MKNQILHFLKEREKYVIFLILVLILLITEYFQYGFRHFAIDDAFISFRYVKNFSTGNGIVFNAGEYVEGYSNLLLILLMTLLSKVSVSPLLSSIIIGHLAGLGVVFIFFLFSKSIKGELSYHSLLGPFLLSICFIFVFWSNGGLGTQLNTFLLILSVYLFNQGYLKNNYRYCKYHTIVSILFLLSRPENFILILATVLFLFLVWEKKKDSFIKYKFHLIGLLSSIVVLFLFRLVYYNGFLPNTVLAKTKIINLNKFFKILTGNRVWDYFTGFFESIGGWPVIVLLIIFFVFFRNLKLKLFLGLILLFYLCLIIWNDADWMPRYRLLEFITPIVFLMMVQGIYLLVNRSPRIIKPTIILAIIVYFSMLTIPMMKIRPVSERESYWGHLGRILNKVSTKEDVLLTSHLGYISYYYKWRVLDWAGLTDKFIAKYKRRNRKKVYQYMIKKNPTYFLPSRYNYAVQFFRSNPQEMTKYFYVLSKKFRRLRIPFFVKKRKLKISDFTLLFPDAKYIEVNHKFLNHINKSYSDLISLLPE